MGKGNPGKVMKIRSQIYLDAKRLHYERKRRGGCCARPGALKARP
jgi:hypothetical protein